MDYLIKFWSNLVISGEKKLCDVPNKIISSVISTLIQNSYNLDNDIDIIKHSKISEMSNFCNRVITNGFDMMLSNGETFHFSLETFDQLKISKLNDRAKSGVTTLPYHADGESCKFFNAEDIIELNDRMENHIEFNVTYCNSLRDYIESMSNINDICDVYYGIDIPIEFQSEVLQALYSQK